jgi:hypothetical protein
MATGLSQASVTGITTELMAEGLIEEKQIGAYEGGRPPILLSIRADGVHVMGVDLTMAQISVVIINFKAELKAAGTIPTGQAYYSPEEIVEMIARAIQSCMWNSNLSKDQIAGVGIGIPGPVDPFAGVIRFLPNYGWQEVPFYRMLKDKINHGSGVKAGDFLFSPMFDTIENLKNKRIDDSQTKIIIKEWNDNDWGCGSGTLVLHEIYKSPTAN